MVPEMEGAGEEGLHKVPLAGFFAPSRSLAPPATSLFYTVEGRGKGRERKREEGRREKEHRATETVYQKAERK